MKTPKTILKQTAFLTLHPLLAHILLVPDVAKGLRKQKIKKPEHHGAAQDLEDDWQAFLDSIRRDGIKEPLKVIEGTEIVADGRHRLMAARELSLDQVPVNEVSEVEALKLMESTISARRHMSKGQRAYAAVCLHPYVTEYKKGGDRKSDQTDSVGLISRAALGQRFGVSDDLINQACKLYTAFDDSKTLREAHEKLIWAGFGLGGILAGVAGAAHTGGKGISTSNYATGFVRRFATLGGAVAEKWEKITNEDDRMTIADGVHTMIMKLPPELRQLTLSKMEEEV
jgi:hypothetical protein